MTSELNDSSISDVDVDTTPWPPGTCVAAFIWTALDSLSIPVPEQSVFTRLLGTSVPPGTENPWQLSEALDEGRAGVLPSDASVAVNEYLRDRARHFAFHHIDLNCIPNDSLPEFISECLSMPLCRLGIGYNYYDVIGRDGVSKHVGRLCNMTATDLTVWDDALGKPIVLGAGRLSQWTASIARVAGGFWLVALATDISKRDLLSYCIASHQVRSEDRFGEAT